jgi:hypothetical protein
MCKALRMPRLEASTSAALLCGGGRKANAAQGRGAEPPATDNASDVKHDKYTEPERWRV